MTTRLSLYNGALLILGERPLTSVSENREPRRQLDSAWDGGAINYCLESGQWNFAMRTVKLEYSPSVQPDFGYRYAFDKPDDFVRVAGICEDEYFNSPLVRYSDEASYWFADIETIYVQYVSDDAEYGNDLNRWPESFCEFVKAHLAAKVAMPLTQNLTKQDAAESRREKALRDARSRDAMAEPTKFMPMGAWVGSRGARINSRRGGGYR